MDLRFDSSFKDLDKQASHVFRDFMTRIAKIDELRSIGYQLLVEFHRELGFFRRPPLEKESKVVQNVIKGNQTCGLKTYIEAGCRHPYMDARNIRKLNLCQQGLKGHLNKVKPLLDELGSLLEDGLATMQAVNRNSLRVLDKYFAANRINQEEGSEIGDYQAEWSWEETEALLPSVESLLLTSILMRATYSMLKCDYEMQERIILSLGLGSSLEELEGYCLMWDLRPFIDDDMMQHCWRLIPQTCAPK